MIWYIRCLKPKYDDEDWFIREWRPQVQEWVYFGVVFAVVHFYIFLSAVQERRWLATIHPTVAFLAWTRARPGFNWINHGSYISVFCYMGLGLILLAYLLYRGIKYCLLKNWFLTLLVLCGMAYGAKPAY